MKIYLYFNAVIYALLAVWCILSQEKTSNAVGYSLLGGSGRSEYLVVYGGLQIGLALFFFITAYKHELRNAGLLFAVCLYLPIFISRIISFLIFSDIGSVTKATAVLELVLTVWGVLLFLR